MSKSPSLTVKERFGDKAKLVAALGPLTAEDLWLDRVNETKGLSKVSNAKLLRLYQVLTTVKEKFGTRGKLIDAICEIEKRAKDEGYKSRLLSYPVPRLFDHYRAVSRRASPAKPAVATAGAAKPKAGAPAAAKPKAPAKKAPSKKA